MAACDGANTRTSIAFASRSKAPRGSAPQSGSRARGGSFAGSAALRASIFFVARAMSSARGTSPSSVTRSLASGGGSTDTLLLSRSASAPKTPASSVSRSLFELSRCTAMAAATACAASPWSASARAAVSKASRARPMAPTDTAARPMMSMAGAPAPTSSSTGMAMRRHRSGSFWASAATLWSRAVVGARGRERLRLVGSVMAAADATRVRRGRGRRWQPVGGGTSVRAL
jgi:hypothetical protein